jgi:hypothetical protein
MAATQPHPVPIRVRWRELGAERAVRFGLSINHLANSNVSRYYIA